MDFYFLPKTSKGKEIFNQISVILIIFINYNILIMVA